MARQFRERWIAGAFIQQIGTNAPSSLTGLNAASLTNVRDLTLLNVGSLANLQANSLTGGAGWRGISQLNSGIAATSVQATAAISGATVHVTPYNYLSAVDSFRGLQVQSVGTGFFNVQAIGSIAPTSLMPFAWSIIR